MWLLFVVLSHLLLVNTTSINEILSKFEEDKCLEDNFIDPELLVHAQEPWQSVIYNKGGPSSSNSLSLIHELAHLNKIEYYYYLENEEGPAHKNIFYITLTLGNEEYKGDGMSVKEAKRHAAEEALLYTKYIIPQSKENKNNEKLTPTVELNNIAMKLGMTVRYLSEDELLAEDLIYKQKNFSIPEGYKTHLDKLNHSIHHPYETKMLNVPKENKPGKQFKVGVIVGDKRFIGIGYTLQSAKHDAAKNALLALQKLSMQDIEKCINEGVVCNPDNNKSPISVLYELAQEKGTQLNFEVVGESGPAHEKVFITKCEYGDVTIEGSGKSKKLSKRNASENMLEKLKYVTPSVFESDFPAKHISKKKKKKKKLIKSRWEKFSLDAKNFISSTWEAAFPEEDETDDEDSDRNSNKQNKRRTDSNNEESVDFKLLFLNFAQKEGISANFIDLGVENSKYYSLVFVGLEPKHVCLGEGQSYDLSRQKASLEALHFFYKLGITNLVPGQENFEHIKNMDFGKMYIIGNDIVPEDDPKKE
ncbi:hypothetical protein AMK59_8300 [Oryctes borbonicus]|uniref:DRBM domain-containing protein n=1 Tax=Oryctes borbonicus TaxID=1629725 RepID=A0A0T6AVZ5_9SCAR|nr:hypothetical protein AMK59_8300 [Oryctes borbonicus]